MKFYGQFNPPVDEVLYSRYFSEKRDGFFIECGAYDGITDSCCKCFEELGWKGINIEAAPRLFKRLEENRQNSFLNLNRALSDKTGSATFFDIVSPSGYADGNGSLSHHPNHLQDLKDHGCERISVSVETITYRDLIRKHKVSHVDLFVLDIEGCELRAIDGMGGATVLPSVMCVEFSFSGLNYIQAALAELGYRLDFTEHVNAFFSLPQ